MGTGADPLFHHLLWRDSRDDDYSDLEEVVYDLFPHKVVTERGDRAEIIQELRVFWHFRQHVYQLPQAWQALARLTRKPPDVWSERCRSRPTLAWPSPLS